MRKRERLRSTEVECLTLKIFSLGKHDLGLPFCKSKLTLSKETHSQQPLQTAHRNMISFLSIARNISNCWGGFQLGGGGGGTTLAIRVPRPFFEDDDAEDIVLFLGSSFSCSWSSTFVNSFLLEKEGLRRSCLMIAKGACETASLSMNARFGSRSGKQGLLCFRCLIGRYGFRASRVFRVGSLLNIALGLVSEFEPGRGHGTGHTTGFGSGFNIYIW